MKLALFGVTGFSLVAFVVSLLVFIVDAVELKWAIAAGALGLVGVGLALNSFMLTLRTDDRMNKINATLSRIAALQEEIQKEQKEQANSSSPIVTSLQALSQHYMDLLTKPKSKDE